MRTFTAIIVLSTCVLSGCKSSVPVSRVPTSQSVLKALASGLAPPQLDSVLKAIVTPPLGWAAEPLKQTDKHRHQIWISPTGATAYGIIYFDLPFPVGPDLALWGFMRQMKQSEGEGDLLSKTPDDKLPGIRFVAAGGLYTIRSNLTVDGSHGWAVYAGTIRVRPINSTELKMAEDAREQTRVNIP